MHDAGAQLALHRLPDLRDVVADHVGQHAAEEVQIGPALRVGHPATRAGHQLDRLGVVERHPGREHGPVPGQQERYAAMTMCAIFLIALVTLPFAPETKGQPLPE